MSLIIPIAHDFSCAWCYIGIHQVRQLQAEFSVQFDWLSYELFPVGLESTPYQSPPPDPPNKPKTPSRLALALAAQGIELPKIDRPDNLVSRNALLATEFVKQSQDPTDFIEAVYRAYWDRGEDISDIEVLVRLAEPFELNREDMAASINGSEFAHQIVEFDEPAYSAGVYNLPTLWIGGERLAEQPLRNLKRAIAAQLELHGAIR